MKKWTSQLTRAIRKHSRKCWRSAINRRLVSAAGRLSMACLFLVVVVGIERTPGTNAFFSSADSIENNSFTTGWWVVPTIAISSPAAGDEWQVGSSHYIHWSAHSADPAATAGMLISIDYACDGGASMNIAAGTANDGSFTWTVPDVISDDCQVSIMATDSHGLVNAEDSSVFEISSLVVLNEFMSNPVSADDVAMPGGEWVELYNKGTEAINVSGWYLYDAIDTHELAITADNTNTGGTTVAAHGWLVVYRNGDGDFALNDTGSDTLRLFNGVIGGSGVSLIDSTDYTVASESGSDDPALGGSKGIANPAPITDVSELAEGKTWARFPDGTGPWFDPVPTPGEKNSKSMDLSRFQKYYRERCLEDGKVNDKDPVCEKEFLISLGVIEVETKKTDEPAVAETQSGENTLENDFVSTDSVDTASKEVLAPLMESTPPVEAVTEIIKNEESSPSAPEEDAKPEETVVSETKAVPDDDSTIEASPEESVKPKEDPVLETKEIPADKPVAKESKAEEIKAVKEEVKDEKEVKKEDATKKEEKDDGKKEKEVSSGKVDDATDNSSGETVETTL